MVINAKFSRENHSSIPRNYDRKGAEPDLTGNEFFFKIYMLLSLFINIFLAGIHGKLRFI
jgi:hypothetical protein